MNSKDGSPYLACHFCWLDKLIDGNGQFTLDGAGVPVVVEADIEIWLLSEVLDALHVDHLLELGPSLHSAVPLLHLQHKCQTQRGRARHGGAEILKTFRYKYTVRLNGSNFTYKEWMICFVAVEYREPT